jgi:hypothetical protein
VVAEDYRLLTKCRARSANARVARLVGKRLVTIKSDGRSFHSLRVPVRAVPKALMI